MPVSKDSKEDKTLIKNFLTLGYYNAKRVSRHRLNVGSVYKLSQKLWVTGLVDCCIGCADDACACTADTVELVYELV